MKIYIGADHNGFDFKLQLSEMLQRSGHQVVDAGDVSKKPDDDFPQFAAQMVGSLLADSGTDVRGILICGSGQGMAMAANRFKGVRAALCWNLDEARSSRNDDDANVLCLSSRYLGLEETEAIVNAWLSTSFAGAPRFVRRLKELDQLG